MDGNGFVVLTNSENGGRLAFEIMLSVAAVYGWPDKRTEREAITLTPGALAKLAGDYDAGRIGRAKIRVEHDHLVLTLPDLGDVTLFPQSADTFFSLGGVPDLKFSADGSSFAGGNVTAKRLR